MEIKFAILITTYQKSVCNYKFCNSCWYLKLIIIKTKSQTQLSPDTKTGSFNLSKEKTEPSVLQLSFGFEKANVRFLATYDAQFNFPVFFFFFLRGTRCRQWVSLRSVGGASAGRFAALNTSWRLGGHRTSLKAPPSNLELTNYRQCIPLREKKKKTGKKFWSWY